MPRWIAILGFFAAMGAAPACAQSCGSEIYRVARQFDLLLAVVDAAPATPTPPGSRQSRRKTGALRRDRAHGGGPGHCARSTARQRPFGARFAARRRSLARWSPRADAGGACAHGRIAAGRARGRRAGQRRFMLRASAGRARRAAAGIALATFRRKIEERRRLVCVMPKPEKCKVGRNQCRLTHSRW